MLLNHYMVEKVGQRERQERMQEAERERLARSILAWLKGEGKNTDETWMTQKPEPQLSKN